MRILLYDVWNDIDILNDEVRAAARAEAWARFQGMGGGY